MPPSISAAWSRCVCVGWTCASWLRVSGRAFVLAVSGWETCAGCPRGFAESLAVGSVTSAWGRSGSLGLEGNSRVGGDLSWGEGGGGSVLLHFVTRTLRRRPRPPPVCESGDRKQGGSLAHGQRQSSWRNSPGDRLCPTCWGRCWGTERR
nr:uncharacterized protein LOC129011694 [Pongo pygmaeus]